jgi:redox-sensing transcriptional repressor
MARERIPQATAKRLPLYYRFLQHLSASGRRRISSSELSELVKIDSATIRRDLSYLGALGKKGYGYSVERVLTFLRSKLDQDELTKVMLIGVGNLGKALLKYNFLKNNNSKIVVAYDTDYNKVGTTIGGTPIRHIDQLKTDQLEDIQVAILTVPADAAQLVVDQLILTGVTGVLNFTPVRLSLPSTIRIHHIDLAAELQTLIYFLKNYPLEP